MGFLGDPHITEFCLNKTIQKVIQENDTTIITFSNGDMLKLTPHIHEKVSKDFSLTKIEMKVSILAVPEKHS